MQTIIKHYVEEFFPVNTDKGTQFESIVRNIHENEINPLKFNNNLVSYFRFFDIAEVTLDNGKVIYKKRKNYSLMYYRGKRLNRDEIDELVFCAEKGVNSVIKCYNDTLITNPNDEGLTIDEFQEKVNSVVKVLSK